MSDATPRIDEATFNARFVAGLDGYVPPEIEALVRHAWLVRERNEVMNLTRVTEPEEMARLHVLDSLAAAPILAGSEELPIHRVLDLGTGAGWPGLSIAIALPHLEVTLLDARRKKIEFLREVVTDLGLEDRVHCQWGRFEEFIRPRRHQFDAVLARAVGPLPRLLEWCTGRYFGRLVLWKGPAFEEELAAAEEIMQRRAVVVAFDMPYDLPGEETGRRLVILENVGPQ